MSWLGVVVAVAQAALVAGFAQPLLVRLPAPVDEPDSLPYRPLATRRFAIGVGALTLAAALLVALALPTGLWWAWVGLNTCGALLAAVDARTTFLPLLLTRLGWALSALGCGLSALATADVWLLPRAALGAGLCSLVYYLFWRFAAGFGFGDVRVAALTGGTAAAVSVTFFTWAFFAGAVAGMVWGLIALARGSGRGFPYGPSLILGPYLALALTLFVPLG